MPRMKTREEFFDGDDTSKWSGEAARQLEVHPPGTENVNIHGPFEKWYNEYPRNEENIVFDFGCGTGLARSGFMDCRYIGVDQNLDMLKGAQTRWEGRDPRTEVFESPLNQITQHHPSLMGMGDFGFFLTVLQHIRS